MHHMMGEGGKKACEGKGKQKTVGEDVGAGWIGGGQLCRWRWCFLELSVVKVSERDDGIVKTTFIFTANSFDLLFPIV